MMNRKFFQMPFPDEYKQLQDAIWDYYELCFPDFDEDERYDLSRGPIIEIEDTVKRLYKKTEMKRQEKE